MKNLGVVLIVVLLIACNEKSVTFFEPSSVVSNQDSVDDRLKQIYIVDGAEIKSRKYLLSIRSKIIRTRLVMNNRDLINQYGNLAKNGVVYIITNKDDTE